MYVCIYVCIHVYTYIYVCRCITYISYYTLGGLDDVNCYRTVERYDPQTDEWTEVASLKSPRGGVGVATLGKFLYAAGGNDGSTSLQTVERWVCLY